jgi:hypothetical protein
MNQLIAKTRSPATLNLGLALAGVAGGAGGYVAMKTGAVSPALFAVLVATGAIVSAPVGWLAWFRLDEAAREAHKAAWMHGGSLGTLLAGLLLALLLLSEERVGWSPGVVGLEPMQAVALGAAGLLLLQAVGYGLVWAAWWLSKR